MGTPLRSKMPTRAGRMAQAVDCLPSKHEALSSNPRIVKKEKKKKLEEIGGKTCNHISLKK
jgi:hypothetical protein